MDSEGLRSVTNAAVRWPRETDSELHAYFTKLSAYEGCVLWGNRVVVPPQGQESVLRELHEGHPGITRMKSLARMYVWWPNIGADIEQSVRLCAVSAVQSSIHGSGQADHGRNCI